MKNFITGFFVGVVSLIPGISGGTILLLFNEYNNITYIIAKKKNKNDYIYLTVFIIGVILGAILFAKIIEYLFTYIPYETLLLFSIILVINIIKLIKIEQKKYKFNKLFLLLGLTFLLMLSCFTKTENYVVNIEISTIFLIIFFFCGALDGFITILPGISGSMVMMILGPYYIYKSMLSSLSINNLILLLPLSLYLIADLIGIYLGSVFSNIMIKHNESRFMSFLLGLMIMSTTILIPFKHILYIPIKNIIIITIITCIMCLILFKNHKKI